MHFKTAWIASVSVAGLMAPAMAQDDIPLLRPEERKVLEKQEDAFTKAIASVLTEASKSTVRVWDRRSLRAGSFLSFSLDALSSLELTLSQFLPFVCLLSCSRSLSLLLYRANSLPLSTRDIIDPFSVGHPLIF